MTDARSRRLAAKRADYMRLIGKPLMVTESEMVQVRQHVRRLYARGMSYQGIGDTASPPVHDTLVARVANERHLSGSAHRETYTALMQAYFVQPTGHKTGRVMDPVGVRRRLQALVAQGFGYGVIGRQLDVSLQAVHQLVRRTTPVRSSTVGKVCALYDKLDGADPFDFGATDIEVSRARMVAKRSGFAPGHCWDSDTIDDPEAIPEWTGACGTESGYQVHYREKTYQFWADDLERWVYACPLCRIAHQRYKAEAPYRQKGEEPPPVWTPRAKGRPQKTHCKNGHDLTVAENVYVRRDGKGRACYICNKERGRVNHAKKVEAQKRDRKGG